MTAPREPSQHPIPSPAVSAKADPAAIDLDALGEPGPGNERMLIAAVVALRKLAIDDQSGKPWRSVALESEHRWGEADRIASDYLRRAEAAEGRVAELEGIVVHVNEANDKWFGRAIELAEALTEAIAKCSACGGTEKVATEWTVDGVVGESVAPCPVCNPWRTALAALPAKALKRAKVVRKFLELIIQVRNGAGMWDCDRLDEMARLAREGLDALDQGEHGI